VNDFLVAEHVSSCHVTGVIVDATCSDARTRRRANRMSFKFSTSVDSDATRQPPMTAVFIDCVQSEPAPIVPHDDLHQQQEQQQHHSSADTAIELRVNSGTNEHALESSLLPTAPSLQTLDEKDVASIQQAFCSTSKSLPEASASVAGGNGQSQSGSRPTSRLSSPSAERSSPTSGHATAGRNGRSTSPSLSSSSSSSKVAPTLRKILSRFRVEQVYDDFSPLCNNTPPTSSSMSPLITIGASETATVEGYVDEDERLPTAEESAGIRDGADADDDKDELMSRTVDEPTSTAGHLGETESLSCADDGCKSSTAAVVRILAKKVSFQISDGGTRSPSADRRSSNDGSSVADDQQCQCRQVSSASSRSGDPWIVLSNEGNSDPTVKTDNDDGGIDVEKRKRSKAWFRRKGGDKKTVESPLKLNVV